MDSLIAYGLTAHSLSVFGYTFAIHFVVMVILWLVGRGHKNDSILDVYWGFSFVIAVWMAYGLSDVESGRSKLVLALVTIWGARLGYHLFSRWARIHALGGDLRYQDIKDKLSSGGGYAFKALLAVYFPMWLSYVVPQLNIMLVVMSPEQPPLAVTDYILAAIMIAAIVLEITADLQLDAFKANHSNEGKVLNTGVWAWSRHPNYFANFCCYWCIFLMSLAVSGIAWTVISPLFMSWLLIGFTGKKWMDSHMSKRRPGYSEYIRKTSGFIPMPPKH
jgi:steroid 5-alpha reductase family enzyme